MFKKKLQTLLTNLGAAEGRNNTQFKRKLKEGNCTKQGKRKFLKALERGSMRVAQYSNKDRHAVTSFCSWYRKKARSLLTYSLTRRLTSLALLYSLTLLSSCFTLLYSLPPFIGIKLTKILFLLP